MYSAGGEQYTVSIPNRLTLLGVAINIHLAVLLVLDVVADGMIAKQDVTVGSQCQSVVSRVSPSGFITHNDALIAKLGIAVGIKHLGTEGEGMRTRIPESPSTFGDFLRVVGLCPCNWLFPVP